LKKADPPLPSATPPSPTLDPPSGKRAVQQWQLVGVRIQGGVAEALFDHLAILPVAGLKRLVFHGRVTCGIY